MTLRNKMNILIVYAHPESRSFNGALKDKAETTFKELGHDVIISDLYKMKWSPIIDTHDFTGARLDDGYLDVSREQENSFHQYSLAQDIINEQNKVSWADIIIFQFPVWWFSMPAIMKGWIDRVFCRGFAYSRGRKYGKGHFKGKKAMLCLTTGTPKTLYEPGGMDGDLYHILWPIHNGILAYTGFTVLPPYPVWMPARLSIAEREEYLNQYSLYLKNIETLTPLYFHPWEDYDDSQRLKPGIKAKSGVQWNPQANQTFEESASQFATNNKNDSII